MTFPFAAAASALLAPPAAARTMSDQMQPTPARTGPGKPASGQRITVQPSFGKGRGSTRPIVGNTALASPPAAF